MRFDITTVLRDHGIGVGKKPKGTAVPSDVLAGKTFMNDSGEQIGAMPNNGVVNQTIALQNGEVNLNGYVAPGSKIKATFPNLTPSNIKKDVNVGNVVGTLEGGISKPFVYVSDKGQSYDFPPRGSVDFAPMVEAAKQGSRSYYSKTYDRVLLRAGSATNTDAHIIASTNIAVDLTYVDYVFFQGIRYSSAIATSGIKPYVKLGASLNKNIKDSYAAYEIYRIDELESRYQTFNKYLDVKSLSGMFYLRVEPSTSKDIYGIDACVEVYEISLWKGKNL